MPQSNLQILTQAHTAVAAKRRARRDQPNEVVFDEEARRSAKYTFFAQAHLILFRDFLTGFHKRKLAKTQAARQKAIQREKQERLETRREVGLALVSSTSLCLLAL